MNSIPNLFGSKFAIYGNVFRLSTVPRINREHPIDSVVVRTLSEVTAPRFIPQVTEVNIPQEEDVSADWILYNNRINKLVVSNAT